MKFTSIHCQLGGCHVALMLATAIPAAHATITVNGTRDTVNESEYAQLAVQQTGSNWGSNHFLANLHAVQDVSNTDLLNIFIGGGVQDGNGIYLFIDSRPGGFNTITNNLISATFGEEWRINNLGTSDSAGMTFEADFEADYVVHVKGEGASAYVNRFDLQAGSRTYVGDAGFVDANGGFISSSRASWSPLSGSAQDHLNGLEMTLNIARLGVPVGLNKTVKVMAVIINDGANYGSNQVLDSRTANTGDIAGTVNSIDFETEDGTQTVSITVNNPDTDSDNMPDSWENLYGLNVGVDDSASDTSDNDDSPNLEEYQRGTLPNNPDTDGDTVKDGWETNDGNWVSSTATGTDPLDTDSDNDGLTDGQENNSGNWVSGTNTGTNPNLADTDGDTLSDILENNSGTFVNASSPGTNPNLADTDGDTENDGIEIFQGTNPTQISSSSAALGNPLVEGTRDTLYGAPIAVQTIETGFGDNQSEWNAAYARVNNGKLYLLFTGNLQANFNKLEIFIDSKAGGSTTYASSGNDGTAALNGMTFDAGFAPDYHLVARRGLSKFDLDMAVLGSGNFSSMLNTFQGSDSGRGITGTGAGNSQPIRLAYNGSNTAGVGGNTGVAADQVAAAAVTTGLELCISLQDLGNPIGPIKVMLLQASSDHTYLSNQSLAGLPDDTANLGNLGAPSAIDFSSLDGDQFFSVGVPDGYADWAADNVGGANADQDSDGDGVENGLEFFMGQTGSTFTANPQPNANGLIAWPRDPLATGVNFTIWTSPDLSTWTNATASADVSDPNFVKYTIPNNIPKNFVRFSVTVP